MIARTTQTTSSCSLVRRQIYQPTSTKNIALLARNTNLQQQQSSDKPSGFVYSNQVDALYCSTYQPRHDTARTYVRTLLAQKRQYEDKDPRIMFKYEHIPLEDSVSSQQKTTTSINLLGDNNENDDDITVTLEDGTTMMLRRKAQYEHSVLAFAPNTLKTIFTALATAQHYFLNNVLKRVLYDYMMI